MTPTEARTALSRMTAASTDPTLTDGELDDLLFAARRPARPAWLSYAWPLYTSESVLPAAIVPPDAYREWVPSTAYAVGTKVTPTTRNAHVYIVTTAGLSGSTEPTWPTTAATPVTDNTVTWAESGPALYTL